MKFRRREKCFDLGTNRHRESLWCESFRRSPLATLQRVFLARVPFIVLYKLSLPSPFCQFCSPLIFRPSNPHPVQPSQPSPHPPHPPHPCDSCSKENHPCSKEISERFVRKQPFKTVTCALQTARQTLRNPPQKQKNADFLKFFESKSCTVQKVAVLLHSLTEKTGMPVSSERQQKFFEKIP